MQGRINGVALARGGSTYLNVLITAKAKAGGTGSHGMRGYGLEGGGWDCSLAVVLYLSALLQDYTSVDHPNEVHNFITTAVPLQKVIQR